MMQVSDSRIAVLPGDGIGVEVMEACLPVLEALAARIGGFRLSFDRLSGGADEYRRSGTALSDETMKAVTRADAILFGAMGLPDVRYPDGTEEPLLNVPNYHFDSQRNYELAEPKRLPKGTEIIVEGAWDNSALNLSNPDATKTVGWGDQTFHEMFFASYRYTYPDAKPPVAKTASSATTTGAAAATAPAPLNP